MVKPEDRARQRIDEALTEAGWAVQDTKAVNIHAGRGVAIREFLLKSGHGSADYPLHVDGNAVGVVEAKKERETLTGVDVQSEKYSVGLPDFVPAPLKHGKLVPLKGGASRRVLRLPPLWWPCCIGTERVWTASN